VASATRSASRLEQLTAAASVRWRVPSRPAPTWRTVSSTRAIVKAGGPPLTAGGFHQRLVPIHATAGAGWTPSALRTVTPVAPATVDAQCKRRAAIRPDRIRELRGLAAVLFRPFQQTSTIAAVRGVGNSRETYGCQPYSWAGLSGARQARWYRDVRSGLPRVLSSGPSRPAQTAPPCTPSALSLSGYASLRHAAGESIASIAQAHKRSPRAIELRPPRLGMLPRDE
jgi:hypothetical protein